MDIENEIAQAKAAVASGEKAIERQYLESIRPEIERAARERGERERLKATVEAQQRAAKEQRKPWLERAVDVPMGKYRPEQKQRRLAELRDQVSVVFAKQRDTARRRDEPPVDNRPTPERASKLMGVDAIAPPITDDDTRANSKAHEVKGVVEFYADKGWSYEELQGARYLVDAWHKAAAGEPRLTPNYDGTPGGTFGARDGGVKRGAKTEHFVDAHNQIINIEAILFTHFGAKGVSVIKWLIWETVRVAHEGAGLVEQMETAGKALAPFVKDRGRLWGITYGYLKCILRFCYAQWVVKEQAMRQRESTPEQIAMRRQQRIAKFGALGHHKDERRIRHQAEVSEFVAGKRRVR